MTVSVLKDVFSGFEEAKAKVETVSLSASSSDCYALVFELKSSKSGEIDQFPLGEVGGKGAKAIRLSQDKVWWLFPHPDLSLPDNANTQFVLLQLANSKYKYAAILPITTPAYMGTLRSKDGHVVARFERDSGKGGEGKVVVCLGNDLMSVVRGAADGMREIRGWGNGVLDYVVEGVQKMMGDGGQGTIFSDTLTYCTWNSLFPVPRTTTSILKTLTSLKANHIHPTTLLIDDAWQSINDSGEKYTRLRHLTSFEAWSKFMDGMHGGLKAFVSKVKEDYGLERVGVWHTISGYWQGIDPESFKNKYRIVKVTLGDYPGPWEGTGFQYYVPHPESVHDFFDAYYKFLSSCGITFTKCDNVASLESLVSAREVRWEATGEEVLGEQIDMPTLRLNARQAVKDAAEKYFGGSEEGRVIWCMEMSSRIYLGKEVGGSTGARMICRNSDDYFPDIMDSHRYHVYANVLNGIFTSQLNVVPDLDMFQSHAYIPEGEDVEKFSTEGTSAQAEYHAALRSVANGPVTLTDVAGHTDPTVLAKLLGKSSKTGRSIALQAKKAFTVSGAVFDDLLGEGTGKGLKVYSEGQYGGGLIGVWNVRSKEGTVKDELTFDDVLPLTSPSYERTKYAVYSFKTSTAFLADKETSIVTPSSAPIQLDPFGFDIFTIVPFLTSARCSIACLGLTDKYNPLAALVGPPVFVDDAPATFGATFKCVGYVSFVLKRLAGAGAGETGSGAIKVTVDGKSLAEGNVKRRWASEEVGEIVTVDFTGMLRDDPSADADVYEVVLEVV
ncbi:glycoside hydrolase family 36 protein [Calocera viscosa TUFC12733]|uniref:Glycoside hydrolase family 36 protein n=1 Tax=Calocera viscosa (strain TUFC12733) TaxID=1330018 RepID=A0A167MLS2_CALVF|nr:glycoside hydrolase family 36 protein [Calocera viscosa TUFC12733]